MTRYQRAQQSQEGLFLEELIELLPDFFLMLNEKQEFSMRFL